MTAGCLVRAAEVTLGRSTSTWMDRKARRRRLPSVFRDHACEDGDLVSVYIGDGYGDSAVFTATEIFNAWQEKMVTVRAGYYYQVRAVAVNGTGGKCGGGCGSSCTPNSSSHVDVNSGEMRVRSNHTTETNEWSAPGGSERAGIVNVIAQ